MTWKMCRCPVQEYACTDLVQFIDQCFEIFCCTKSSGRRIVSESSELSVFLIQVFHNRMKFYMSIVKFFDIVHKLSGIFPVSETCFINRNRLFAGFVFPAGIHPLPVLPFKRTVRCNYGSSSRRHFCGSSIRICLICNGTALYLNLVFVHVSRHSSRYKQFKNAGHRHSVHRMTSSIPVIKISYHTDLYCIRCPYSKAGSFDTIDF